MYVKTLNNLLIAYTDNTIDSNHLWAAHLPRLLIAVFNDAEATERA